MIDEQQFRRVMSRFASGVTVVTTAVNGTLAGLTVSSFTSLSLEPRLVLVCIGNQADTHSVLERAGWYAVNILSEAQAAVSQRFASNTDDKFIAGSYTLSQHGLPLLAGVLATLECRTVQQYAGGDHTIFVGEVVETQVFESQPLLYYRAGYARLGERLEP